MYIAVKTNKILTPYQTRSDMDFYYFTDKLNETQDRIEAVYKYAVSHETDSEFYKRIDGIRQACIDLNKRNKKDKQMKTSNEKLLKRIEQTKEELVKLEAELNKPEIPEYVEIVCNTTDRPVYKPWHHGKGGLIVKVVGMWLDITGHLQVVNPDKPNETHCLSIDHYKPSTKAAFDKQNEIIRVPECITFGCGETLGIVFNNHKQVLYYNTYSNIYSVGAVGGILKASNFKLTKCERSDLKAGDVAYYGYDNDFDMLINYSVILDKFSHAYISDDTDVQVSDDTDCGDWYKVERV